MDERRHLKLVPARPPLSIDWVTVDGCRVMACAGALDVDAIGQTRSMLLEPARESDGPLIVDLSGVELLDSSGLGALIRIRRWATAWRVRTVVVAQPSSAVQRVIAMSGLARVFSLADSVDQAVVTAAGTAPSPTA